MGRKNRHKHQATSMTIIKQPESPAPLPPSTLRFSPLAYLKLVFMRDKGPTEVGGMALTAVNDPFYIEDFIVLPQECTAAFCELKEIAAHLDRMADRNIEPARCCRIWIHTHPGDSATPSGTDEKTFAEEFGTCDYAVMFILAKGGATSCRCRINYDGKFCISSQLAVQFPSVVDAVMQLDVAPTILGEQWAKEYADNVKPRVYTTQHSTASWAEYNSGNSDYREICLPGQGNTTFNPNAMPGRKYTITKTGKPALYFRLATWKYTPIYRAWQDDKTHDPFAQWLADIVVGNMPEFEDSFMVDQDGEVRPYHNYSPNPKAKSNNGLFRQLNATPRTVGSGSLVVASRIPADVKDIEIVSKPGSVFNPDNPYDTGL
jgi:hypothetical protein